MTPRDIAPSVNDPVDFFVTIFSVHRAATSRRDIAPSVNATLRFHWKWWSLGDPLLGNPSDFSHKMEAFFALLAFYAGKSPVTGEFPSQRPVTLSFDVFFDLRMDKRLCKQLRCQWFESQLRSLWRQYYGNIEGHTAHTIVSWPNSEQWIIIHTSDLMMINRE